MVNTGSDYNFCFHDLLRPSTVIMCTNALEFEMLRVHKGRPYTKNCHWYLWRCSDE